MKAIFKFRSGIAFVFVVTLIFTGSGVDAGKAPLFTLEMIDGGSYTLADDLDRHVILLEFWGTCCKTNLSNLKFLEDLQTSYGAKGLKVFAINVDDASARSRIKPAIRKYGYTFPILLDPAQEVLRKFSPNKIKPSSVIIGRDGQIAMVLEGDKPGNEKAITDTIARLME